MIGGSPTRRPGLTLIEILITTALFAMASIVLAQIFVSFNRLDRKISYTALIASDLRYDMELLVRESRNKLVNYDVATGYPDAATAAASSELHLIDPKGEPTDVALRTVECGDLAGIRCLAMRRPSVAGGDWQPITGKHVNVRSFGVYVRPNADPFAQGSAVNVQPMVTFKLDLEYVATNPADNVRLDAQTTVSTRTYQR